MNRKEFLKILRKELSFLTKEELEKEVLYYINQIDSAKEADTEIIKGFGGMEKIVKEVCKKHGLNYKEIKEEKQNWFKNFYTDLVELSTIVKKKIKNNNRYFNINCYYLRTKNPLYFRERSRRPFNRSYFRKQCNHTSDLGINNRISLCFYSLNFFCKNF